MKHPKVKYQLIEMQQIGRVAYKVKVMVKKMSIQGWEYVAYLKPLGRMEFNKSMEYVSKEDALEALNMYQQYGLVGGEEKVIQSN